MDNLTVAQEKTFDSSFGKVTVKIPSALKRVEIGKRMQRYAQGIPVDSYTWDLIEAFSTFDLCATEAPWKKNETTGGYEWDEIYDEAPLLKLFGEVKEWIDSFRKPLREESGDVGKD